MGEADNMAPGQLWEPRPIPPAALWLGGLGLVPFIAGAASLLVLETDWAYQALRFYAASILAFMGGIHWGLVMADPKLGDHDRAKAWRLATSVMPALIAWLALLLHAPYDLVVMAAAFALLFAGDLFAVRQDWAPAWYPKLRAPLTVVVVACLAVAAWANANFSL